VGNQRIDIRTLNRISGEIYYLLLPAYVNQACDPNQGGEDGSEAQGSATPKGSFLVFFYNLGPVAIPLQVRFILFYFIFLFTATWLLRPTYVTTYFFLLQYLLHEYTCI
jgi:hypothetical protein